MLEVRSAPNSSALWVATRQHQPRVFAFSFVIALLLLLAGLAGQQVVAAAAVAPALVEPAASATVASFRPTLRWTNPAGTTQYHLQVVPVRNEGAALDMLAGSPGSSYDVPGPPQWYGLLPDMTYTWRVRVSDAAGPAALNDASWSPWAERTFRTPKVVSTTLSPIGPADGATLVTRTPTLQWADSQSGVFLYELQVSKDPTFARGTHTFDRVLNGATTTPVNSFAITPDASLDNVTTYYWRVRPRVQGDGTPLPWGPRWRFTIRIRTDVPLPLGRIAFTSYRDGTSQIYLIDQHGTERRLTTDRSENGGPVWSPDGTVLAYTSVSGLASEKPQVHIWIMNGDGSGRRQLTSSTDLNVLPTWSPDGTRLAFVGLSIGAPAFGLPATPATADIYTVNVSGAGLRRLTSGPEVNLLPVWSPDSSKIAYTSLRNLQGSLPEAQIWAMDSDGAYPRRITTAAGIFVLPAWSRDSATLSYMSVEDVNSQTPSVHVYVADSAGSYQKRMTSDPGFHLFPMWSPDGGLLAYTSIKYNVADPAAAPPTAEIYTVQGDGSDLKRLTSAPSLSFLPMWSPDGRKLAYHALGTASRELMIDIATMNRDGSGPTRLTRGGLNALPFWSPDSAWVGFTSVATATVDPANPSSIRSDVFMANASGTVLTNLTTAPGLNTASAWSPVGLPPAGRLLSRHLGPPDTTPPAAWSRLPISAALQPGALPLDRLSQTLTNLWTNWTQALMAGQ